MTAGPARVENPHALSSETVLWTLGTDLAAALGAWLNTLAILAIVMIGFVQQRKAEHAINALRSLSARLAKVIRDGRLQTVPARDLVPGGLHRVVSGRPRIRGRPAAERLYSARATSRSHR